MITKRMMKVLRKSGFFHALVLVFMLTYLVSAPPWAHAQIPRYINYQGKLTDADDNPVTGDVSITVRLYDVASGGTKIWEEVQAVTVTRGIFSILLGSIDDLDDLDFNDAYWYSVEVESDGEMTPRQRLTAVAYAMNADKLDGYDASDFLTVDALEGTDTGITVSGGLITAGPNEDIELNPTGLGNIVMTIDSTSGDFKVTDGTTNWLHVDNETGNVTISQNLAVGGTIYGDIASTGGDSTFSSITVTGASDLQGNLGVGGDVDVTGNLDVTGTAGFTSAVSIGGSLDLNSNLDLDYTGTYAALDVKQGSTGAGPAARFTGAEVVIGDDTGIDIATTTGNLYVQGDLEVDGTIYGNIDTSGSRTFGDTTLSTLTVTGTTTLNGALAANAAVTLGDNGDTVTINSSYWDITATGDMTGIGGITMDGDFTASDSLLDIDKSYTNPVTGTLGDHVAITRNITLNDDSTSTLTGNILAISSINTQTSGTLTDNSTLLHLKTGANVGSSAYFIYAEDNADSVKFKVDKDGDLWIAGTQTVSGGTTYEGQMLVDYTDPNALLVRKDGAAGDIFIVDTTNSQVEIYSQLGIGMTPTAGVELDVTGDGVFSGTLSAGGGGFDIDASGNITDVSDITSDGAISTSGNISTSAGTITAASGLTVSAGGASVSGGLNNNADGISNAGAISGATTIIASSTITQLSSVGLIPEYDSATPRGDGSDNFGTLSLKYDNSHNYYEWTTNEPTAQDYDIIVRYRLPDGFSSLDASAPIKLFNLLSSTPNTATRVKLQLLDTDGSSVLPISSTTGAYTSNWLILNQNTSWAETMITIDNSSTELTSSDTGKYITLIIKLCAYQGDRVDVGEMTLKGNW